MTQSQRWAAASGHVRALPRPYARARGVEQALVVAALHERLRFGRQQAPERIVLAVHAQVLLLVRRRDLVGAEQEAVRVAIDEAAVRCVASGDETTYLATSSHEMSKCTCASAGSSSISSRISRWLGLRSVASALADDCVGRITRPRPVCAQMIVVFGCRRSRSFVCVEVHGLGAGLRERHVDVVVQQHDEPDFAGEIEDAVERRIGEARGVAGHLRRHELLVDRELADAA